MLRIGIPELIHERGLRPGQEDSVYPAANATQLDRLFIVCDGVGGNPGGEWASSITCKSVAAYLKKNAPFGCNRKKLYDSLKFTQRQMKRHVTWHPGHAGMATTFTLLFLNDGGICVAWTGDSRIYQIRDGAVEFRSRDHSLLQELLDSGELNPGQIHAFPYRNVITRSLGPHRFDFPDFIIIEDYLPGDYFMLLTDGILDAVKEKDLVELFRGNPHTRTVRNEIAARCRHYSSDNYSLYLMQILEVNPS